MPHAHPFALALAAALLDVTLGYPEAVSRRIGSPSRWIAAWLEIVRAATGDAGVMALAVFLVPVAVAAALIAQALPDGPIGFAIAALLTSTFCGRQKLDARARETARIWEDEGVLEGLAAAEAMHPDEAEPRLGRASAGAIAARFADEVAAPTVFILIGGLAGAALCRALVLGARILRERRDGSGFARAIAALERWTITPAARAGALFLGLAAGRREVLRAVVLPAPTPTAPAEAAMRAALDASARDDPGYLRRALALFRRATAVELLTLAALALVSALAR